MKTIADPCCGSGGFFLAAQAFLADPENYTLDREQKEFLKNGTFYGNELVASTFKLCLMNLYLHNIGDIYGSVPVAHGDSLLTDPGYRVDYVLTNPPFGKKSSLTFTNEEGEQEEEDLVYNRQDFWTTSSNKQLNFVQHINTILKATGKAAVVVPDNVLFEGGAGEIVRKKLLATCDLHTIFYDKVDKFLIAMRHTELSEINALCDAIEKYAIELNFFNITSSDIDVIISTVNAIKDFLTSKIEEYYENPEGKKNFDSKAYQLYEKLGIANEFNDYLTNTTVRVAVSPYIILAGDGGVGKSHLIADYIDNCDSLGQTSLLLLGQQFSAGMDVLAILPTLLGCDITYHELFDIFEAIACTQKSRVLICIDIIVV